MFRKRRVFKNKFSKTHVFTHAKWLLVFLLCGAVLFGSFAWSPVAQAAPNVSVSAKAAILINADTGEVLFAKNENERLAMASTTKIMTALLVLEQAAVSNPEITMTDEMVTVEGSSMGLRAGYRLHLKDLAVGMLMVSGNDAANAGAIAVGGSKEAFVEKMNQRARELGMNDTSFVTPSGLDAAEHYSTAKDMATLGAAAIRNPDFRAICSQKIVSVKYQNPDQTVRMTNHNKLLSRYSGCIGIKTGFTKKAGRCLVTAAERDGVRLVAVTLHAPDDWNDHQNMFDYGFSLLKAYPIDESEARFSVPVVGGEAEEISVRGDKGNPLTLTEEQIARVKRVVELPRFVYAPVEPSEELGCVRYEIDGKTVAAIPLTAEQGVEVIPAEPSWFGRLWNWIKGWFS